MEEATQVAKGDTCVDVKEVSIERSWSGSQRELHESQEKAKELELELERVVKRYESENTHLMKDELLSAKGKLGETQKKHEELKVVQKKQEEKLKTLEENFSKTDALLSQALSKNSQLEHKLKSLEELHTKPAGSVAAVATQKNLELKDVVRSSNQAAGETKSQIKELETRFTTDELEQILNLLQLKNNDIRRELRELSEEASELQTAIEVAEEERKQDISLLMEYQETIAQLEALSQLSATCCKLEKDVENALQRGAEHEDRANTTHQCNIELEGLYQTTQSKHEDTEGRSKDLELLLQTDKYRIQELEEQISSLEKKRGETEAVGNDEKEKKTDPVDEMDMTVDEAREEHYKADDASSAVSNEYEILNSEKEREDGFVHITATLVKADDSKASSSITNKDFIQDKSKNSTSESSLLENITESNTTEMKENARSEGNDESGSNLFSTELTEEADNTLETSISQEDMEALTDHHSLPDASIEGNEEDEEERAEKKKL